MRIFIKIVSILFLFNSCKKEKTYRLFSEKELDFVSYSKGQNIRFLDTNNIVHTLVQDAFEREFREFIGIYGNTNNFNEEFQVRYYSIITGPPLGFSVSLNGKFVPYTLGELSIYFGNYIFYTIVDSLKSPAPTLSIMGTSYFNVYSLKTYKNGWSLNNTDTATLYYNKQFGVIQLLLPNGKAFTRTN